MDLDTRERAAAKAAGRPVPEAAELLGASEREACRLAKPKRETGAADGSTGARRGRPPKVGPEEARLREEVAARLPQRKPPIRRLIGVQRTAGREKGGLP